MKYEKDFKNHKKERKAIEIKEEWEKWYHHVPSFTFPKDYTLKVTTTNKRSINKI